MSLSLVLCPAARADIVPSQESGLPESTPPLQWALASLGPSTQKLSIAQRERGQSAVRLPSNLILWHTGTSLQQSMTCLCTAELSQIAPNSHSNHKVIPHLDTHFQVMILYVPFSTNVFPEGIQPSSEFPHRGTSCLRLAGEGCWDGCKGTRPFSFLSFSPTQIPLLEYHQ